MKNVLSTLLCGAAELYQVQDIFHSAAGLFQSPSYVYCFDLREVEDDVAYIRERHFPDADQVDPTITKGTRAAGGGRSKAGFPVRISARTTRSGRKMLQN
jgi:hypothetical protein